MIAVVNFWLKQGSVIVLGWISLDTLESDFPISLNNFISVSVWEAYFSLKSNVKSTKW